MGLLFSSRDLRKKNAYKKKMYKKIEKSSKICLCMIKKISSHIHIKNPPKNRPHKKKRKKELKSHIKNS